MSLKSPATYAEWYWKHSVDASSEFDENIENLFSPHFSSLLGEFPEIHELPPAVQNLVYALVAPQSPGFGGFALGVGVETVDEVIHTALGPAMSMLKRSLNRRTLETWPTTQEAITLAQRKVIADDYFYDIMASEGYEKIIGDFVYESRLPYPSIPEIMTWARYHGNPDNVRTAVWEKFDVPARDFELWEWLSWQRLTTLQVQTLLKRNKLDQYAADMELARIGWHATDRETIRDLSWTLPNAMLQVQGNLHQEQYDDKILSDISLCDIHPDYAQSYLDAILTKPNSQDVVAYHLRIDPNLSGLDTDLRKIGIHPAYWPIYKELAQQIPPIPDIITMAVREAFTPAIAERFGQYQDFPPDFAMWAAKKGLTEEWSKRYWAAHWNLPSPQQGFEMLHRGVINRADLDMLMRAQDIMPFWRDKLSQIAYRVLTRVDVRRMYKLGVLDEKEVVEAYLDAGYDDENARRMAEFTVKQTLATQAKFTSTDIVKAFSNRVISASDARSLLVDIGVRSKDAQYIVSTAQYKRQWRFTEQQIRGVRNLYKKREYDENAARRKLATLNLPADQIDVLMKQWWYEIKEEPPRTWTTAQTLGFMEKGIIGKQRAEHELRLIGYDAEHIDAYMKGQK